MVDSLLLTPLLKNRCPLEGGSWMSGLSWQRVLIFACCLFIVAFPVWGQTEISQATGYLIEDNHSPYEPQVSRLVQIAYSQHPQLLEAASEIRREAGLRLQATRRPNPSAGYSASEVGNEGRGGQQGVFVGQQWITAGKLDMAGQAGQWRTRAAMERMKIRRLQLSHLVHNQYWSLVAARQRTELLARLERSLGEAVEMNQALLDAAEISQGTLIQAMLERNQMSVAVRQAQFDLQAKSQALATTLSATTDWVDSVPSDPWPLTDSNPLLQSSELETEDQFFDFDHHQYFATPLLESAGDGWRASPELSETAALVEAAKWELKLAQVQIISDIDGYATVQHDAVTNNVIVGVQVGMFLPVNDRKTGLVESARATVNQLEARRSSTERDLQIRWTQALNEYRSAVEMFTAIEHDLRPLSRRRFDLARQAYSQGEIDYLDLLTAQRSYLLIQQNALDMREQATQAAVRLRHFVVAQRAPPD